MMKTSAYEQKSERTTFNTIKIHREADHNVVEVKFYHTNTLVAVAPVDKWDYHEDGKRTKLTEEQILAIALERATAHGLTKVDRQSQTYVGITEEYLVEALIERIEAWNSRESHNWQLRYSDTSEPYVTVLKKYQNGNIKEAIASIIVETVDGIFASAGIEVKSGQITKLAFSKKEVIGIRAESKAVAKAKAKAEKQAQAK